MKSPPEFERFFPWASPELLAFFDAAYREKGWLMADALALRDWLEVAEYQDEPVCVAVVLLMLSMGEGSLCLEISPENLDRRLGEILPPEQANAWAQRVALTLSGRPYPKLIGTDAADALPLVMLDTGTRHFLYFQKLLRQEREFVKAFLGRLPDTAGPRPPRLAEVLHEVLSGNPAQTLAGPLQLDADQKKALDLALTRPTALISGGPGTGKTSLVTTLLRCWVRLGVAPERITLAAPTGRAAQRLTDALAATLNALGPTPSPDDECLKKVSSQTLHALLGFNPATASFRRHAENPVPADVVIVDEVSMVGIGLMAKLLQALAPATRLILLGDKDQLPSVEAGAVLANLMVQLPEQKQWQSAIALLHTNHRSQPHIHAVARAVNQGDQTIVDQLPLLSLKADLRSAEGRKDLDAAEGCKLLELGTQKPEEMHAVLRHWAEMCYLESPYRDLLAQCLLPVEREFTSAENQQLQQLFLTLEKARLLHLLREGPWGCVEANRYLEQFLRAKLDRDQRLGPFAGMPILITRTDKATGLFNGEVGVVLRSRAGGYRAAFARQAGFVAFPLNNLPPHETGFALTIHKSQGSEYQLVLVVLPPSGGKGLLTRELVYTGITRAKKLALLCSSREVLKLAIARRCVREAGLLHAVDHLSRDSAK